MILELNKNLWSTSIFKAVELTNQVEDSILNVLMVKQLSAFSNNGFHLNVCMLLKM